MYVLGNNDRMQQYIGLLKKISEIAIVNLVVLICILDLKQLQVLASAGVKDPIDVLSDFLGREPSIQAYIENKVKYVL